MKHPAEQLGKFFKLGKNFSSRGKPPDFDICDLYPEKLDKDFAEDLADHFNAISLEFNGLDSTGTPQGADNIALPQLSTALVAARLRLFKKTMGGVGGDIFPALVTKHSTELAVPLTRIFNAISSSGNWPAEWKTEYVTPIPKRAHPQSANDLRNISCTMLTSVLNWPEAQSIRRAERFWIRTPIGQDVARHTASPRRP